MKSVHWLGLGTDNLVHVKTDEFGRIICTDLEEKIVSAIHQNKRPFYVNATAGTTVMGAFDDLNAIADICLKYNLWLHVDVRLSYENIFDFLLVTICRPVSVEV